MNKNYFILFVCVLLVSCAPGWIETHKSVDSIIDSTFSVIGLHKKEPPLRLKSPDKKSELWPYRAITLIDKNVAKEIDWEKCEYKEIFDKISINGEEKLGFFPSWECKSKSKGIISFEPNKIVYYGNGDIFSIRGQNVQEDLSPVTVRILN